MYRVLCLLAIAAPAHAEAPEIDEVPHVAVSGTVGLGTPLGFVGAELEAHLSRWASLAAGAGMASQGPQLAVMARGGIPLGDSSTLTLGLGLSEGKYQWTEFVFDEPAVKTWNRAYWTNAEAGVAFRFGHGPVSGRPFVGFSRVINGQDYMCNDEHCATDHQRDGEWFFYTGFAVAYAL
jgi:hypothetical protein